MAIIRITRRVIKFVEGFGIYIYLKYKTSDEIVFLGQNKVMKSRWIMLNLSELRATNLFICLQTNQQTKNAYDEMLSVDLYLHSFLITLFTRIL